MRLEVSGRPLGTLQERSREPLARRRLPPRAISHPCRPDLSDSSRNSSTLPNSRSESARRGRMSRRDASRESRGETIRQRSTSQKASSSIEANGKQKAESASSSQERRALGELPTTEDRSHHDSVRAHPIVAPDSIGKSWKKQMTTYMKVRVTQHGLPPTFQFVQLEIHGHQCQPNLHRLRSRSVHQQAAASFCTGVNASPAFNYHSWHVLRRQKLTDHLSKRCFHGGAARTGRTTRIRRTRRRRKNVESS